MRIAVLSNAYPPHVSGGAGRIAFVYAELLRGLGHEVRVWEARPEFFELGKRSLVSRLAFHARDLWSNSSIVEEILAWKPDVLLSHNLTGCGFGTPSRVQAKGVRWIHVLHDVQLFEPSGQIIFGESFVSLRQLWRRMWGALRRSVLGAPDVVVSPTKWLLDLHRSFGFFQDVRSEVIPNPLLVPAVDGEVTRDPRQLLYVGRMDEDKGMWDLKETWRWTRVPSFATKLVLIGTGPYQQEFSSKPGAVVDVRGQQSPVEVARAMRESGVVVVPSLVFENQPTVILEALAAGCSVVATDVGGVRETLGSAGWIVQPRSVMDLERGILEALEFGDSERYATRRAEILRQHQPEMCVARLESTFRTSV